MPDTIVVSQFTPALTILLIFNLLLVGLAWYNLKEIRRLIREFLEGEDAKKIAAALAEGKEAEKIRQEFLKHTHDEQGMVRQ